MTSADGSSLAENPPATGHFQRSLGLWDAVSVVVGSMIGSGIFIVSAETARHVGSPAMLLLCWILAGGLTICAALCYSELAAMFPQAGGQYVFLRKAYGPLAGFLYGWTLFTVIQCGTIAAVGVGFAKFFGVFIPQVSEKHVLLNFGNWKMTSAQVISVGLITLLTAVNCRGVQAAKTIQTTFTAAKLFAIGAIIVAGFLAFNNFQGLAPNLEQFWQSVNLEGQPIQGVQLLMVIGLAMVGPLFACDAWNNITFAGEEVKDAEKILPKSLALGTLIVVGIYLLANVVYLLLLPLHGAKDGATLVARGIQFASEDRVGTAAAEMIFGQPGAFIMAGAIMISTFGCLNGLILAGARVYYAMAKEGLFFKRAAILDAKTNVPVFGLVAQGAWSAALAMSGTYGDLLDYVVFAALLFYVLTVGAVILLRVRQPDIPRPYKVFGYPFLPILYMVAATAVMVGQMCLHFQLAAWGLVIILSGLPVYFICKGALRTT